MYQDNTGHGDIFKEPETPSSVSAHDGEGPESVTPSGRNARELRAKAKMQQMAADAGMPDPYANRKMPAQMTQAQIDARDASDSPFARDAQGNLKNRKQPSMAKVLINPDHDDYGGFVAGPRDDGREFETKPLLKPNPQSEFDVDDESGVREPVGYGQGQVDPPLAKAAAKVPANIDSRSTASVEPEVVNPDYDDYGGFVAGDPSDAGQSTAGMDDENTTDLEAEVERPKLGTSARAYAIKLGYPKTPEGWQAFLKANSKNVNRAANGVWVVHPTKDYIPYK